MRTARHVSIDTLNAYCRPVLVTGLPLCQGRLYNIREDFFLCYPASFLLPGQVDVPLVRPATDSWVIQPGLGSAGPLVGSRRAN